MPARPSLTALRAFEAVARNLSVSAAAVELHVTRPAVSRQVSLLEAELNTALLIRSGNAIQLTAVGEDLLAGLSRAFDLIAIATRAASRRADDARRLRILVCRDFASSWLAGQIGAFLVANPGISVEISAEKNGHFRLDEDFDFRIFYGMAGAHSSGRLRETELCRWIDMPVCTSAFRDIYLAGDRKPAQAHYLIDANYDVWDEWCTLTGTDPGGRRTQCTVFNETTLCLSVAGSGGGLTIGDSFLTLPGIRTGDMIVPYPTGLVSAQTYSLFTSAARAPTPAARRFESWLRGAVDAYQTTVLGVLHERGITVVERPGLRLDPRGISPAMMQDTDANWSNRV